MSFEQRPKEAEFLDIAAAYPFEAVQLRVPGACAGDHTITFAEEDYIMTRSTGLPCSFNPSGCRSECMSNPEGMLKLSLPQPKMTCIIRRADPNRESRIAPK